MQLNHFIHIAKGAHSHYGRGLATEIELGEIQDYQRGSLHPATITLLRIRLLELLDVNGGAVHSIDELHCLQVIGMVLDALAHRLQVGSYSLNHLVPYGLLDQNTGHQSSSNRMDHVRDYGLYNLIHIPTGEQNHHARKDPRLVASILRISVGMSRE